MSSFWEWKCNSCKWYDFDKDKCTNNKCHTIGREEDRYLEYEKAYDCKHRELLYDERMKRDKSSTNKYYMFKSMIYVTIVSTIVFVICTIYLSIVDFIHALANPELTRTQLFLWSIDAHPIANIICLISFIVFIVNSIFSKEV